MYQGSIHHLAGLFAAMLGALWGRARFTPNTDSSLLRVWLLLRKAMPSLLRVWRGDSDFRLRRNHFDRGHRVFKWALEHGRRMLLGQLQWLVLWLRHRAQRKCQGFTLHRHKHTGIPESHVWKLDHHISCSRRAGSTPRCSGPRSDERHDSGERPACFGRFLSICWHLLCKWWPVGSEIRQEVETCE